MVREGYGRPPVPYAWLALGSEGRREQTLRTDQDNALIFADNSQKSEASRQSGTPRDFHPFSHLQRVTEGGLSGLKKTEKYCTGYPDLV
jgi:hypothetical protein